VVAELSHSGLPMSGVERDRRSLEPNVVFHGISTARGVAIGPIYRLEDPVDLENLEYTPSEDPAQEGRDLLGALAAARREIDQMREAVGEKFGPEFAAVFYAQIQILEDKGFVTNLEREVAASGDAAEALRNVIKTYRATFERIEDPYFRERGADVEDVGRRVVEKLLGVRHHNPEFEKGSIVVAREILPGLFARLDMDRVAGIVAEHGGPTSHGAIFARTLEKPAVTGVAGILNAVHPGELAVVDGGAGRLYLRPDEALLREYRGAQHRYAVAVEHLDALRERPAETRDGRRIRLTANVGLLNDLRLVEQHGAEGIGLFRTELLALAHRGFPSEEEQEQLYMRVVQSLVPRPVTIRTLDLGGDKGIPNIGLEDEANPQLGCRSIRLSLQNQRAFRAQIRAVLRASASRNVRLLLPMISEIGELRAARQLIEEEKRAFAERDMPHDPRLPVGVMIEVPSAAIIADSLAREADFFSIGTNDLTQYTLAVDRGNERVAHLYDPLHPAVLALIDRSIRAAGRAGIPVSLCGEMASDPLAVPLLVGLGIDELSGTPSAVPLVKEIVRALDSGDVAEDARAALASGTAAEVHAIAARRLCEAQLTSHPDLGDWLSATLAKGSGRAPSPPPR
jgi:phosphoenolpyruvate-protein phosphotransferase (PTS system enzyme I)